MVNYIMALKLLHGSDTRQSLQLTLHCPREVTWPRLSSNRKRKAILLYAQSERNFIFEQSLMINVHILFVPCSSSGTTTLKNQIKPYC